MIDKTANTLSSLNIKVCTENIKKIFQAIPFILGFVESSDGCMDERKIYNVGKNSPSLWNRKS